MMATIVFSVCLSQWLDYFIDEILQINSECGVGLDFRIVQPSR